MAEGRLASQSDACACACSGRTNRDRLRPYPEPPMPGTVELTAQVENRIVHSTDAELVAMVQDHPGDYEPWALDLGKAELARRGLSTADVGRIREEVTARAAEVALFDWRGVILTYLVGY